MRDARKELVEVRLDHILLNPNQPRQTFDDDETRELAASIEEEGLIQPPTVKPSEAEGYFDLVAGERRIRAARILGWEFIECLILSGESDPEIASLVENCCRKDLNPIDEARYLKKLRGRGKTIASIGRLTGRAELTILNRLKLLELPEEIQEMVRTGSLPQVGALSLAQYRGEKGRLIRMAHDLAAGRDAFTVGARELGQTAHGINLTVSKLPKSPAGILGKILAFYGWRANTAIPLAKAFLALPSGDQKEACRALTESSRKNLLARLESLSVLAKELHSVISLQKGWDAPENSELEKQEAKKPPARATLPEPEKAAERTELSLKPKKTNRKTAKAVSTLGAKKKAEIPPPEDKSPAKPNLGSLQVLPPKAEIFFRCMVYDRNEGVVPDISVASLSRRIYGDAEISLADVESRALQTLIVAKERWNLPPNTRDSGEDNFRIALANARSDTGCRRFEDLLALLRGSRARDPIALSRIP